MSKRQVDIDDALLEEAQRLLETTSVDETLNRALEEAIGLVLRNQHFHHLARLGLDLLDPEVMAKAWPH